ncbi:MAG: ATP-binding cassette, subfamily B, bacterial [Parcubacteria group bacterium LiPW_39]|nr:MAG: ATP-binding cassette, subfamily B, bacterial [Parcubacteria group bacterium LiPW_39]
MKVSKEIKLIIAQIENRRKLYLGIAAAILASVMVAFIPYIYGRLLDIAIKPGAQIEIIIELILLWLSLSLFSNLLNRFTDRYSFELAIDVTNNLIVDLFYHLASLPISFHKGKKTGKITRRAQRGIDELYNLLERTVFDFFPAIISFAVALTILLFVEWRLSLILLIAATAYVLLTLFYTRKIVKEQKAMNTSWEKAYGELFDSVINVHTVKSATAEEFERRRNAKNFNWAGRIFKNWRFLWTRMGFWQQMIFAVSFIAVFVSGVAMLKAGTLTPGLLVMFVGYTSLLTSPLARLADQYRQAKTAIDAFRRAAKYYDIALEKDLAGAKELEIKGGVIFENVYFGYKNNRRTLKNISFEVKAGQTTALVGASGVGKTTIVDLVGRYYFPQKGRILIDGMNIKKIKLKSLRSQMALVPQEVLLFNDTIKNNIKYGNSKASDEQIIEATRAANAHEFIEKFPKKYEQLVGERGIKLSTGQKQRVAIARAILRDPKILILDEATSALDSISEKLVQEALQKLIQNRTTFVIAHRLSTIQHADKIIVLEKGEIAEQGTHEELMRNPDGIYRNFWEMQRAIEKVK